MISRNIYQKTVLLITVSLLAGCSSTTEAPVVSEIQAQPGTTIQTGDTATLMIPALGTDLKFAWSALRGNLSDPTQPAVVYTAPDSTGPDVVTVKVRNSGGEIIKNINFNVVEPPPSPTPITDIPFPANTPTVVPEPIACDSPAVSKNLFPQLADADSQFPIYGPPTESRFLCEAVYDIVHDQPLAVHIAYENAERNFGWWGIATPDGYNAAFYSEICFWAYAQQPNQSFRLKMKDMFLKEDGVIIILEEANQWTQNCTDLTEFSGMGIRLDSLDNVNLGFEEPTGSAEIWVADFEFK